MCIISCCIFRWQEGPVISLHNNVLVFSIVALRWRFHYLHTFSSHTLGSTNGIWEQWWFMTVGIFSCRYLQDFFSIKRSYIPDEQSLLIQVASSTNSLLNSNLGILKLSSHSSEMTLMPTLQQWKFNHSSKSTHKRH